MIIFNIYYVYIFKIASFNILGQDSSWDESIKCLFLRVRNPCNDAYDELVKKVFKIKIHSNEGKNYLEKTRKSFTDFQNKLNNSVLQAIDEYKNIRGNRYLFYCLDI